MHVRYKTIVRTRGRDAGEYETHEFAGVDYCCDDIEDNFRDYTDPIGFGDKDSRPRDPCVAVYRGHHYPEGSHYDTIPIQFCPFCGAGIELEEAGRFREVETEETVEKTVTNTERVPIDDVEE